MMTNIIKDLIAADKNHKEVVASITGKILMENQLILPLIELLGNGSDTDKGTAAEILKFVSLENPAIVLPHLDVLIKHINYPAPRVKWGCPETIGNLARSYPVNVEPAVPELLENLKDKSTVVRWCAAFALAEIAKYNTGKQKYLLDKFQDLLLSESNNGVRNLFLKAIKVIEKSTSKNHNTL